jgi:hypothetical protein
LRYLRYLHYLLLTLYSLLFTLYSHTFSIHSHTLLIHSHTLLIHSHTLLIHSHSPLIFLSDPNSKVRQNLSAILQRTRSKTSKKHQDSGSLVNVAEGSDASHDASHTVTRPESEAPLLSVSAAIAGQKKKNENTSTSIINNSNSINPKRAAALKKPPFNNKSDNSNSSSSSNSSSRVPRRPLGFSPSKHQQNGGDNSNKNPKLRQSARIVASVDAPVHDVGGGRTSLASVQSLVPGLKETSSLSPKASKTKATSSSGGKKKAVKKTSFGGGALFGGGYKQESLSIIPDF